MKGIARTLRRWLVPFWDPVSFLRAASALPWFVRALFKYRGASQERLELGDVHPCLLDRGQPAGSASGHYFHQDLWAAREVFDSATKSHVDVGSRVDGFVAHVAVFTRVTYVDLRPLGEPVRNVEFKQGDALHLPFADGTVPSLSSLHVIEHVGLGRYGDALNPDGSRAAVRELIRVLAPGGVLLLGVPIGRERVCFNAHRVLDPRRVMEWGPELTLQAFAAVDDAGHFHSSSTPESFVNADYSCGLYRLQRTR